MAKPANRYQICILTGDRFEPEIIEADGWDNSAGKMSFYNFENNRRIFFMHVPDGMWSQIRNVT